MGRCISQDLAKWVDGAPGRAVLGALRGRAPDPPFSRDPHFFRKGVCHVSGRVPLWQEEGCVGLGQAGDPPDGFLCCLPENTA